MSRKRAFVDSPDSLDYHGTSICIWYKQDSKIYILTGIESRYLRDKLVLFPIEIESTHRDELTQSKILEMEQITEINEKELKSRAARIEDAYKKVTNKDAKYTDVHYDTPQKYNDGFKTNFRVIDPDCPYGFIKGQWEEIDKDSIDTVAREVMEETGIVIDKKNLVDIGFDTLRTRHKRDTRYIVYSYRIKKDEIAMFKTSIKSLYEKKQGEVYDLKFVPFFQRELGNYIYKNDLILNTRSKKALELFQKTFAQKGGYRTRKTRSRLNNLSRSLTKNKQPRIKNLREPFHM